MESRLKGLKAIEATTEEQPNLRILFLPRFWGSFESRWERGKDHLVPSALRGWDESSYTLCGLRYGESQSHGEVDPGQPLPSGICRKCLQVARNRGY